nr:OmpA family protein [uncultured Dyadobacter sp.]
MEKLTNSFVRGTLLLMAVSGVAFGQVRINDPGRVVERQAENRANRKIDQAVDKGLDSVEQGIGDLFKKKEKKSTNNPASKAPSESSSGQPGGISDAGAKDDAAPGSAGKPTLKSYSRFDFIPGDKIVAVEDFSQDAIGDFPSKWNTNSSGEVVTISGTEGKWLLLGPEGVFYPEFITALPENFTLEFSLATTSEFSYYSGFLRTIIAELPAPAREFTNWKWYDGGKKNGLELGLHPKDAGGTQGIAAFNVFGEDGSSVMKNEKSFPAFHVPEHNVVKVSVWRQKMRLRLYVDDFKVWDLPRAFDATRKYNFIAFSNHGYHEEANRYFISDLRLAVGAPDTRNKLITEGKFSTTGILFDINSAGIRPESYGTLKDIAAVLTENAGVKVKIIGHTDSDGDDAQNLVLSKRRAEAVRAALTSDFGIDSSRMQTDGKGEAEPASPNTTPEGRAGNRRVEFVKM